MNKQTSASLLAQQTHAQHRIQCKQQAVRLVGRAGGEGGSLMVYTDRGLELVVRRESVWAGLVQQRHHREDALQMAC